MQPIVLATDGSETATAAAATAIELAAVAGAPLIVVSVWDTPYTGLGYAPVPAIVDVVGGHEDRAVAAVLRVAKEARHAGVDVVPVVRRGFPVDQICQLAGKRNARVIVIGSHGWGRFKRTLHGSVSREVVERAPCAVLVVPACAARVQNASKTEV